MLLKWKNREEQFEKVSRLGRKIWLWRQKVILFEFGSSSLLVETALPQVTVRTSNKSDQRYGSAFERKWLLFQLPRSCTQQMLRRITTRWVGQATESLYYSLLTSGVSEYMRNPTVPCNHQISFAGIRHTCQNTQHIRHKIHFLSSRRPCQALLSKLVVNFFLHVFSVYLGFFHTERCYMSHLWLIRELAPCQHWHIQDHKLKSGLNEPFLSARQTHSCMHVQ